MKSKPKLSLNPIVVELSRLVNVEDGWNGNNSKAPTYAAIKEAMVFARNLPSRLPIPIVNYTEDGRISIFWSYGRTNLNINFSGNGTYSYAARFGNKVHKAENIPYNKLLPEEVLKGL